jgi:acyl-coenzyme A synthetase/AMP-(fatty) acid ligase
MELLSQASVPTLGELSEIAAENTSHSLAFGDGIRGPQATWEEFDHRSNQAANAFSEYVAQGDRVGFLCENSLDHVTLWNGAVKAGCAVSNLHIRASPQTVAHCIDKLRPRVLVVDGETSSFFEDRVRDRITTDLDAVVTTDETQTDYEESVETFLQDTESTPPDVNVSEDDLAAVLWTSGTTGQPKGWCFTHRALYLRASTIVDVLEVNRSTRQPSVFTPSFAAWYSTVLPALISGASTYFLSSWDPEEYLRMIESHELTTALLVPTMWREILGLESLETYDRSSLEAITSAGEVLDATTLERLRENICEVVKNSYAATEMYGTVMTNRELTEERVESVGKPVPGVRIRVVDPEGSYADTLPPGEVGELAINAPDLPAWAWGDTPKTEESFEDGWWYSGDLGYKDEAGFIYLEGRDDLMILSKGIKVYPTPIEERLNNHPEVEESAVVGIEDEEFGEKVTAYVHAPEGSVTAEELDEWCLESEELARMERPREYRFVDDHLPRTATGKLDRLNVEQNSTN